MSTLDIEMRLNRLERIVCDLQESNEKCYKVLAIMNKNIKYLLKTYGEEKGWKGEDEEIK